ncbi:hypothetical protein AVEN_84446-1 [Araneus ventricosus]|uniref:Endonuclease/exonuclease/phosphatase domain-containing protein n=1 Tax=Araneus ventricosus TaxID=182803 RepID=A0A4Y2S0U4_ARAVE|nr:hypothetical protein AVEN_84446-1 [Araneus ventricosus]
MLELKSRNHLTTGEARRIFSRTSNTNYASAVKSNITGNDFENTVNQKVESIVQSLLEKMEHQTLAFQEQMQQRTLAFQEKMEQQTLALMKMFEKTVETLLQNFKMMNQTETKSKSPSRKKRAVKNFVNFSSTPMHLDAEGPYLVWRQDRSGGGLLTGIPKSAAGRIILTLFSEDTSLEILATEIHFNNYKFIIVNLYAPQGFDIQQAKSFFESFLIPVIIFGDFNLYHPMWGSNNSTSLSNSFVDWLQNSNFIMLNTSNPNHTSYTGTNSLLDLTLCSTSIYHQVDCFVSDSTFESDHNRVVTTWSLLGQFSKTIKTIDWNSIMTNSSEILSSTNSDLHTVMRKVSGIIKNNTKHTVLPGNNYLPWWNISFHNFQTLKKIRTRALRNVSTSDWIKHKKCAAKLRFHIKRASNNYWDKMCNITRNPRMFYSMIKRIYNHSNEEVNVSNLILHNNRYVSNPQNQSKLFLDFFCNSTTHEPIPLDFNGDKKYLSEYPNLTPRGLFWYPGWAREFVTFPLLTCAEKVISPTTTYVS